jgi:hypothetical protein
VVGERAVTPMQAALTWLLIAPPNILLKRRQTFGRLYQDARSRDNADCDGAPTSLRPSYVTGKVALEALSAARYA